MQMVAVGLITLCQHIFSDFQRSKGSEQSGAGKEMDMGEIVT